MCSLCANAEIRPFSGSFSMVQIFVSPGGVEPEQEAGAVWPTCEVHVTSCLQRSVPCKGSPPCGLRAVSVTRDVTRQADCTSDAWKTAGRVRKWQRCIVLSPAALTLALWACPTAEPNHFRQTDRGWWGGYIDCTFRLLRYPVVDRTQTEGFREACVFEMCLHGKSQQATCFSVLYLFYFTGLWATSQLGQLPSEAIQHGWPAPAERDAHIFAHTLTRTHIFPAVYHFSMSFLMNLRPHQVISVSNHKPP